jgi:hypothetical protein
MDKCKLCFTHNNMKALCGMVINSWAILGFNELVVCFRHNILYIKAIVVVFVCYRVVCSTQPCHNFYGRTVWASKGGGAGVGVGGGAYIITTCVCVCLFVQRRFCVLIDAAEPAQTVGFQDREPARTVGFQKREPVRTENGRLDRAVWGRGAGLGRGQGSGQGRARGSRKRGSGEQAAKQGRAGQGRAGPGRGAGGRALRAGQGHPRGTSQWPSAMGTH